VARGLREVKASKGYKWGNRGTWNPKGVGEKNESAKIVCGNAALNAVEKPKAASSSAEQVEGRQKKKGTASEEAQKGDEPHTRYPADLEKIGSTNEREKSTPIAPG